MLRLQRILGDDDLNTISCMEGLTNLLLHQGNESKAESLTRDALNVRQEKLGDFDPCTISNLRGLAGIIYEKQDGYLAEAEKLHKRAVEGVVHTVGEGNPDTIDAMTFLAKIVAKRGNLAEAEVIEMPCKKAHKTWAQIIRKLTRE